MVLPGRGLVPLQTGSAVMEGEPLVFACIHNLTNVVHFEFWRGKLGMRNLNLTLSLLYIALQVHLLSRLSVLEYA